MASSELRRGVVAVSLAVIALLTLNGVTGFLLFDSAPEDPLQHADAIVVLAGEHDGREDYAIALARSGWAPTVVLSNAYPPDDAVMKRACGENRGVEVICVRTFPATTRGEADITRRLAIQRSWTKVIVVTWEHHLLRARLVFRQCFSSNPQAVVMRAMPQRYQLSIARRELSYAYEYAAVAKAAILGDC